MGSGLPAFVEEVPNYTVRHGRMHIGIGDFTLVMPLLIFLEGCEAGKAAIVDWQARECGIDRKIVFLPGT